MGALVPATVIPNGVDTALFAQVVSEQKKNNLIQFFNKKPTDTFLITTSRLVIKNGITDVIKALVLLPSSVKFLILGEGQLDQALRKQVKDLGLVDRVFFVGTVPYKHIPEYLSVSDIFILDSILVHTSSEGFIFSSSMFC